MISFKPSLGILVPVYLVATRRWRSALTCLCVVMFLVLAATLLWGVSVWTEWLQAVREHVLMMSLEEIPEKFRVQMVSVYAGLSAQLQAYAVPFGPMTLMMLAIAIANNKSP